MENGIELYYEDVEVGDELSSFERKTDLMHWNRYAAVNDEFVYIHMDEEAAHKAGMEGVFGMGNLRFAYMHNMLREWIGLNGDIKSVSCQYRVLNYKNDVLTAKGVVTGKHEEDGQNLVDLDIWVENQRGENTSPGKAVVSLPSKPA